MQAGIFPLENQLFRGFFLLFFSIFPSSKCQANFFRPCFEWPRWWAHILARGQAACAPLTRARGVRPARAADTHLKIHTHARTSKWIAPGRSQGLCVVRSFGCVHWRASCRRRYRRRRARSRISRFSCEATATGPFARPMNTAPSQWAQPKAGELARAAFASSRLRSRNSGARGDSQLSQCELGNYYIR